jgi:adenylyltransferase/sulfurtransferase
LCGRNAVQVAPSTRTKISFPDLAEKLKPSGEVSFNPFLLKLKLRETNDEGEQYLITAFADGRAIIQGTNDVAVARGLYARYLGS